MEKIFILSMLISGVAFASTNSGPSKHEEQRKYAAGMYDSDDSDDASTNTSSEGEDLSSRSSSSHEEAFPFPLPLRPIPRVGRVSSGLNKMVPNQVNFAPAEVESIPPTTNPPRLKRVEKVYDNMDKMGKQVQISDNLVEYREYTPQR